METQAKTIRVDFQTVPKISMGKVQDMPVGMTMEEIMVAKTTTEEIMVAKAANSDLTDV